MIVLGLMSGTSVDGIDAAVCEIDADSDADALHVRLLEYLETPLDDALRERVFSLFSPERLRIRSSRDADVAPP